MACLTVDTQCKYFIILQIFKCDYARFRLAFQTEHCAAVCAVTQTFFCSVMENYNKLLRKFISAF